MAKCPLCDARKGKRACPAKRTTICSVCCGEKRIVEIACPPDCAYLGRGIENDLRRGAVDYLQHQDPKLGMRWLRAIDRLGFLLEVIERAIAGSKIPALTDAELLIAIDAVRKTFESEEKGVLYDYQPDSPTLQALTREIASSVRAFLRQIEEKRKELDPKGPTLPDLGPAEVIECLAVFADRCAYHVKRGAEVGSLIGHLRKVYPISNSDAGDRPGDSRIVLT